MVIFLGIRNYWIFVQKFVILVKMVVIKFTKKQLNACAFWFNVLFEFLPHINDHKVGVHERKINKKFKNLADVFLIFNLASWSLDFKVENSYFKFPVRFFLTDLFEFNEKYQFWFSKLIKMKQIAGHLKKEFCS